MPLAALELPYIEKRAESGASQNEVIGMHPHQCEALGILSHLREAMGMLCAEIQAEAVILEHEEMGMPQYRRQVISLVEMQSEAVDVQPEDMALP